MANIVGFPPDFIDIRPLSPGQNADVFRATHRLLVREVFLKCYLVPADDPQSALHEPRLLEALSHESLTRIFGAHTLADSRLLLEMEFVAGGSLKDFLDQVGASGHWMALHEVADIVSDVAGGLGHMHANGFVHRDIKPANIMVRKAVGRSRGVVTDLGLAAKLGQMGRAFASKQSRLYRPPEAWDGKGYSKASDIYQLGIVLFQLLGGTVRYELSKLEDPALAREIKAGTLLDWSTVLPCVSSQMAKVAQVAVDNELARYADTGQFVTALNNARLRQVNWSCTRRNGGFDLERRDAKGRIYRVQCDVDGKEQTIIAKRGSRPDALRRCGQPLRLPAKTQLRSNRRFNALLGSVS